MRRMAPEMAKTMPNSAIISANLTQLFLCTNCRYYQFYHDCPILREEDSAVRSLRLAISEATAHTVRTAMSLGYHRGEVGEALDEVAFLFVRHCGVEAGATEACLGSAAENRADAGVGVLIPPTPHGWARW